MPRKTKEERAAYDKQHYEEERENILKRLKERRAANPEHYKKLKRDFWKRNKTRLSAQKQVKTQAVKRQAVLYLGGKCQKCGLEDECLNVYDFHHRNPNEKDYEIAAKRYLDFEEMKKELDKCDLLCAICHRKIHSECCKRQI